MTRLTVEKYMTAPPITIGVDQPMSAAHQLMRAHRIRHLPVLHGGRLVGVVSDRDLHLVETLRDVDPEAVPVEEAMTADPYAVPPGASLDTVVGEMAARKLGATIILRDRRVVGVFTTIDALRALHDVLHASRRAPRA